MFQAINGHFALSHAYFASDDAIMQEGSTVGEWRQRYLEECNRWNLQTSNYAGYAYDAMWVFALALDNLVKQDPEAVADLHNINSTL